MKMLTDEESTNLRLLVDIYDQLLQPNIKSVVDKRRALGTGTGDTKGIIDVLLSWMKEIEKSVLAEIKSIVSDIELVGIASQTVDGDIVIIAKFLAYVPAPQDFHSVSALWSYMGFNPANEDPKCNPSARSAVYDIASKLISTNDAYRDLYSSSKEKYLEKHLEEEWTIGHVEMAARRVVAKTWLAHLYETTLELIGRQTTYRASVERYGEDKVYKKEKFGWKSK